MESNNSFADEVVTFVGPNVHNKEGQLIGSVEEKVESSRDLEIEQPKLTTEFEQGE